eukprot:2998249-Pleurochrysis_carterae.AAC.1
MSTPQMARTGNRRRRRPTACAVGVTDAWPAQVRERSGEVSTSRAGSRRLKRRGKRRRDPAGRHKKRRQSKRDTRSFRVASHGL